MSSLYPSPSLNKSLQQKRKSMPSSHPVLPPSPPNPTPLQPLTQLYLRQFFTTHFLKQTQKQTQTMFNNSVEVLDCLLAEYEERFGVGKEWRNLEMKSCGEEGNVFEGFFYRLRGLLESVEGRLEGLNGVNSQEIQKQKAKQTEIYMNYHDCLFPQNGGTDRSNFTKPTTHKQTDDQLYQMVVELKSQSQKSSHTIKSLENSIKEKQKSIATLQQNLLSLSKELTKSKSQKEELFQSLTKALEQKGEIKQKLQKSQKIVKNLSFSSQKSEIIIKLKEEQIRRLQMVQKGYVKLNTENDSLKERVKELEKCYNQMSEQKFSLQQKINAQSQDQMRLKDENSKLRHIIAKKLSLISPSPKHSSIPPHQQIHHLDNPNKQNPLPTNTPITQPPQSNPPFSISEQSEQYLKSMIQSILKNEKLVNQSIQTQVAVFVQNLVRKERLLGALSRKGCQSDQEDKEVFKEIIE